MNNVLHIFSGEELLGVANGETMSAPVSLAFRVDSKGFLISEFSLLRIETTSDTLAPVSSFAQKNMGIVRS
jgi:hypothetical protein